MKTAQHIPPGAFRGHRYYLTWNYILQLCAGATPNQSNRILNIWGLRNLCAFSLVLLKTTLYVDQFSCYFLWGFSKDFLEIFSSVSITQDSFPCATFLCQVTGFRLSLWFRCCLFAFFLMIQLSSLLIFVFEKLFNIRTILSYSFLFVAFIVNFSVFSFWS